MSSSAGCEIASILYIVGASGNQPYKVCHSISLVWTLIISDYVEHHFPFTIDREIHPAVFIGLFGCPSTVSIDVVASAQKMELLRRALQVPRVPICPTKTRLLQEEAIDFASRRHSTGPWSLRRLDRLTTCGGQCCRSSARWRWKRKQGKGAIGFVSACQGAPQQPAGHRVPSLATDRKSQLPALQIFNGYNLPAVIQPAICPVPPSHSSLSATCSILLPRWLKP